MPITPKEKERLEQLKYTNKTHTFDGIAFDKPITAADLLFCLDVQEEQEEKCDHKECAFTYWNALVKEHAKYKKALQEIDVYHYATMRDMLCVADMDRVKEIAREALGKDVC